ncbi:bifunctional adenosylcobinamide kinase/adenosylcobinamide-phosphate guanylyltransferase, partial [Escherichia coli]|uniref:bifunctional adenosylcobinamide kinase/adenosylcobinamide-phosphate guanylyltransferase n=1 Tax=Escherichia coli TaxID=562 RepID=UPI0020CE96CF
MMILVTGGARSGKSRHAEALIGDSSQVLYIATSQILDDEMAARIEHHRQGRPEHWRTVERWQHLDELIHADINPNEVVLLECVTTMVTNLLFDCKRTARAVLTGMCYSAGSAMRHGSSSLTRLTG